MDEAVKERLIGAAILVAIVVLVVPALLTGPRSPEQSGSPATAGLRSMEIEIAPSTPPEDPVLPVAEPDAVTTPAETAPDVRPDLPAVESPASATVPAATGSTDAGREEEQQAGPAEPSPASWAVQVAALSSRDSAAAMVDKLKGRGYPAFLLEYRADGRVLYRVRVGPETQRERAESLAARLASSGYPGSVVSHP